MKDATLRDPLHAVQLSQGPRRVLAVHCTMAQSGAWKGVAKRLNGLVGLTAFDLPGHGRSADWDGDGDLAESVATRGCDLLDGPTDLVGHSFGAVVALRMAQMRPETVRTLTLVEPVLMCAARGSAALDAHDRQARPLRDMLARGDREAPPATSTPCGPPPTRPAGSTWPRPPAPA